MTLTGSRLHEEIVDFYDHVKPRSFERKIRGKLVSMLEKFIQRDPMFRDISVQSFGSFASDLYLPTADMDLVICSRRFLDNGVPTISGSKWLHRFRAALVKYNIAEQGTIDLILHAKVPIVKYIDRDSGLRVDVSFENLSGVDAIETFQKWKKLYPAMPILVTVIKHFLGMRGLNEPVNGGIGGFSVVCLVVSMFQLMPPVQSRALQPERHLGEMLMEFFRLYGSFHNFGSVAIRLDPPGYIPKVRRSLLMLPCVSVMLTPPVQRLPSRLQGPQPEQALHHRPQQPGQRHCRRLEQLPRRPGVFPGSIRSLEARHERGRHRQGRPRPQRPPQHPVWQLHHVQAAARLFAAGV
jgi:DNA polymerase sigma